jgi:hypothetical protein
MSLTDPTGTLATRYVYEPFGRTVLRGDRLHPGLTGYFCWARRRASPSAIPKPVLLRVASCM